MVEHLFLSFSILLILCLLSLVSNSFLKNTSPKDAEYYKEYLYDKLVLDESKNSDGLLGDSILNLKIKCFYVRNYSVYDISSLTKSVLDKQYDYNDTINGRIIYYNFCKDISKETCLVDNSQVALSNGGTDCSSLAGSISSGNNWEFGDESDGLITITLSQKDSQSPLTIFKLKCDNNTDYYKDKERKFELDKGKSSYSKSKLIMYFKTPYACERMNFYSVWKFLNKQKIPCSIILMILGLLLTFLGKKYDKVTIFVITTITVILVAFVIFFQYILPGGTEDWVIWVVLGVSIIVGILIGILVTKYKEQLFGIILGVLSGYFLGEFIFNLASPKITWKPTLVHWLIIIGCVIILVLIGIFFHKAIVILSTSLIGAYIAVRGLSLICGSFPSEVTVIDLAKRGEKEQLKELLTWKLYCYLGGMVLLAIIGIGVQIMINREKTKEEKEKENERLLDEVYKL